MNFNYSFEEFYSYGKKMFVPKGEYVYNATRPDDSHYAYFLDSGCCALVGISRDGSEKTYLYFMSKRAIGFSQLMQALQNNNKDIYHPAASIIAKTDCLLYRINKENFYELLKNNSNFMTLMLGVLSENYIEMFRRYHESQDECATVRLCRLYLEYATEQDGKLIMPEYFTNTEISHYLDTHVVTVSRIVAQLKKLGCIEKEGHKTLICQPDLLRKLIDDGSNFDF